MIIIKAKKQQIRNQLNLKKQPSLSMPFYCSTTKIRNCTIIPAPTSSARGKKERTRWHEIKRISSNHSNEIMPGNSKTRSLMITTPPINRDIAKKYKPSRVAIISSEKTRDLAPRQSLSTEKKNSIFAQKRKSQKSKQTAIPRIQDIREFSSIINTAQGDPFIPPSNHPFKKTREATASTRTNPSNKRGKKPSRRNGNARELTQKRLRVFPYGNSSRARKTPALEKQR